MTEVNYVQAEVWETQTGDKEGHIDNVINTFNQQKFSFVSMPRQGDHITLETDQITPPILYVVESVRFSALTKGATSVAWGDGPTACVYVSRLRTLVEYL